MDPPASEQTSLLTPTMGFFAQQVALTVTDGPDSSTPDNSSPALTKLMGDIRAFIQKVTPDKFSSTAIPAVLVVCVWLLVGTIAYRSMDDFLWGEAFYYAVQAGSSIGFGALSEKNDGSRLFTVFFVLFGSSVIGGCLSYFVQAAVEKHESFIHQVKTPEGEFIAKKQQADDKKDKSSRLVKIIRDNKQIVLSLGLFSFWILFGTVFAMTKMETSFVTGVYFAVTACSTGGLYAPTCPRNGDWCFPFVGLYCFVGIPIFGFALGQFATIFVDSYTKSKVDQLLSKRITQEEYDFAQKLAENDGKIDFGEFVILKMLRLGSLDLNALRDMKDDFGRIDLDRSGKLDYDELTAFFDADGDGKLDSEQVLEAENKEGSWKQKTKKWSESFVPQKWKSGNNLGAPLLPLREDSV